MKLPIPMGNTGFNLKDPLKWDFWACLILIFFILAVYLQVLGHDFIYFDDDEYILNNKKIQSGLSWENIIWAFKSNLASFWIPLTWISFMIDFELYGLNPGGFLLTNLLLHIINSLLLYFIFRKLTGSVGRSLFISFFFGLHPLHVESVAWITERKDVLSIFFGLLTIFNYLKWVETKRWHIHLWMVICYILSLSSKPMLVTLPFLLLILDFWPLRRYSIPSGSLNTVVHDEVRNIVRKISPLIFGLFWEKFYLFAVSIAFVVANILLTIQASVFKPVNSLPLWYRAGNAAVAYIGYIRKTFLPFDLGIFYPHPVNDLPFWKISVAGMLLLTITIVFIREVRRHPYLIVGWMWYIGTLLPVIGLLQTGEQAMADRFTYFPLIGLSIIFSESLFHAYKKITLRYWRMLLLAVCGAAITMAGITWKQVGYWKDSITLFKHTLEVTSESYVIHNNLGTVYLIKEKLYEADLHYQKAINIKPNHPLGYYNRGLVAARKGDLKKAITHYVKAIELDPNFIRAYNNLGNIFFRTKEYEKAIDILKQALKRKPEDPQLHNNLAVTLEKANNVADSLNH